MGTGWVWHELYGWHDTGKAAGFMTGPGLQPFGHFESPESKTRFASLVEVSGMLDHLVRVPARPATEADLLRVHAEEHLASMREQSADPRGGDMGDGLSPFGHGGYDIARWAAGGTMAAVRAVLGGQVENAYALVRPPGHHAVPERGMGFCMFANIGVAIRYAQAELGLRRVAVVDWDVHHGNGTEAVFAADPDVLTVSLHQDGNFPPDSGTIGDRGQGDGYGSALNVPLPAGSGRGAYLHAMDRVVLPAVRAFHPELVMVASGFDSANGDPLGRMMLTSGVYAEMTRRLMDLAGELCGGRLVISHEGGYSPVYVPFCGLAVLETLTGHKTGVDDPYEPIWSRWPGQELADHQRAVVDAVAELLAEVPRPTLSDR
ncbi:class II histone deacetylase [Pseudonocardia acaciae]|uniref:class II histone deacetylase n=1 Tax=Pseudonocardia acaciae TaxID=551276 RepID=UPI00055A7891|nr:class II histone deacetylase [Pseudonocardia acaciae]